MRLPHVSFTIRRMLVLIAILALLLGFGRWAYDWAYDRYVRPGYVVAYYIGDLIQPDGQVGVPPTIAAVSDVPPTMAAVSEQAALLKSSVTPDVWWLWWLRTRAVTPFPAGSCLIVRHSVEGHKQVGDWLRQRRQYVHGSKW